MKPEEARLRRALDAADPAIRFYLLYGPDEAGSRARINATMRPPDVKNIEAEIEEIKGRKEASIKAQDFEKAAALRDPAYKARSSRNCGSPRLASQCRRILRFAGA